MTRKGSRRRTGPIPCLSRVIYHGDTEGTELLLENFLRDLRVSVVNRLKHRRLPHFSTRLVKGATYARSKTYTPTSAASARLWKKT